MTATPDEAAPNGTRSLRDAVRALREPTVRLVSTDDSPAPSRLRTSLETVNTSRLGAALAARAERDEHAPGLRELSPELVLIDPQLAAWARAHA
jgi:hypothetical protein